MATMIADQMAILRNSGLPLDSGSSFIIYALIVYTLRELRGT
jgi:hypothetical protein